MHRALLYRNLDRHRVMVICLLGIWLGAPCRAQVAAPVEPAESVQKLGLDFWEWRARYAPFTGDDVPRIEHPEKRRDWSSASIANRRKDLQRFQSRFLSMKSAAWPVPAQVDYRLLGSALARVRWELDVNPRWSRDPNFYVEQTVTPLLEFIAVPGPYNESRSAELFERIDNIPSIIAAAEKNLNAPPAPFVKAAIESLSDIRVHLRTMASSIQPVTTLGKTDLGSVVGRAADSLEQFRSWLQKLLPTCSPNFAIGREAYTFFLHKVALLPYSPEELLAIGQQETARALAFMALETQRNRAVPQLQFLPSTEAWAKKEAADEEEIREFLKRRGILTVPNSMQHYTFRETPGYVKALSAFGETDDFTSATRLRENGVRYIEPPSSDLDFFWGASAKDPRPIVVHEGVPGHYFQLALSWANKDPIRRHFYDSSSNEGLGFYSEEMLLQSGLFDDSPHSREIVYKFMLLRAVGIELDVRLALGEFTIDQGAAFLDETVGLGREMATGGTTMFALTPGVLVGYQTGKTDILRFLGEAKLKQGDDFDLRAFHDSLWTNGNVPIALQRWEYLGLKDGVERLDTFSDADSDSDGPY
jgi:uncharacterized protein (DUF885 family)